MKLTVRLCVVMTLGATLVACQPASSKTGGETNPVSLTVLSYTTNALTGDTTTKLIDEVNSRSGGVTLKEASPMESGLSDGSSATITAVKDGEVDVAVVAARSFDLIGVNSLQALGAPLAVDAPDQAALFLADPIATEMLAGLTDAGVVGLALTYDSLAQPLGFSSAVRQPSDLAGKRVLVRPSRATEALVTALGATADARNGGDAATAIQNHEVSAAVSSFDRPSGFQAGPEGATSTITGNVQLLIKANVIIVNRKVWDGLTPDQQSTLSAAATDTRTWAATQVVRLDKASTSFCDAHIGNVVVASPDELQQWRAAVQPVVAELSRDPVTGKALARLAEIVHEHASSDLPAPCTAAPLTTTVTRHGSGNPTAIEGQWRLAVSAEEMTRTGASQQDAVVNQGTWTFNFRGDGTYWYVEPRARTCPGTFTVDGEKLSMIEDDTVRDCGGQWDFTWKRTGDKLALTPTAEFAEALGGEIGFFTNPLIRIGDVPR